MLQRICWVASLVVLVEAKVEAEVIRARKGYMAHVRGFYDKMIGAGDCGGSRGRRECVGVCGGSRGWRGYVSVRRVGKEVTLRSD